MDFMMTYMKTKLLQCFNRQALVIIDYRIICGDNTFNSIVQFNLHSCQRDSFLQHFVIFIKIVRTLWVVGIST